MYIMAGSPSATPELLMRLGHSRFDKIRLRVAENPHTPVDLLQELAKDANHDIRVAVATNPSSPADLVHRLATDDNIVVRHGLAQDISTANHILDQLSHDDNPWVSGEARKTLQILNSWTRQQLSDERDNIRARKRSRQRSLEEKFISKNNVSKTQSTRSDQSN